MPDELLYLEEVQALHNMGIISDIWQYDALPTKYLDDARLLMEALGLRHEAMSKGVFSG